MCRGRAAPETEHEVAFTKHVRLVMARRDAEAARRAAEIEARRTAIEEESGQRRYPAWLESKLGAPKGGYFEEWD